MKRSKMFIVGIVLIGIGVFGLFGCFGYEGDVASLLFGSILLLAVGAILILYDLYKKKAKQNITPVNYSVNEINNKRQIYKEKQKKAFEYISNNIEKSPVTIYPNNPPTTLNIKDYYTDFKQLRSNTNISRLLSFVSIDVETTGLSPEKDKIVQLSAIRFVEFAPVEVFNTYINPGIHISEKATEINGITDDMIVNAPKFENILPSFMEFVGNSTIIGYNFDFDIKFLRKSGYDNEIRKDRHYFDVCKISRDIDKDLSSHKLQTVCEYNGILFNAHSSDADALATGLLFIGYVSNKLDLNASEYPNLLLYNNVIKEIDLLDAQS